jgi:hypothetical protein
MVLTEQTIGTNEKVVLRIFDLCWVMMRKKLSIVGRGTVGCLATAQFLKYTDVDIDWIYNPHVMPASVGEGTTLLFPLSLKNALGLSWSDLNALGATPKTGIYKEDWASSGNKFTHSFPCGATGLHFNATAFQNYVFDIIKRNPRVNVIEDNVSDYSKVDADYILVCAGSPKYDDGLIKHEEIPVNAAFVTQCYWDFPRFTNTLTIARPYGWVFGIPLQNRCAIGYLYNKDINALGEIKDDVKHIFEKYKLEPSETTNSLTFNRYSRKINFTNRIIYNGNSSFFLEPLEATTLCLADTFNSHAFNVWFNDVPLSIANDAYARDISDVKAMILLHYMAGSAFDTPFWEYAKEKATTFIRSLFAKNDAFAYNVIRILDGKKIDLGVYNALNKTDDMGTWMDTSFKTNIYNLKIESLLRSYNEDKTCTKRFSKPKWKTHYGGAVSYAI